MDDWRAKASKDSAEAIALLSAEETARRIDGFMNGLRRKNIPGVDLGFDAYSLVRDALKNAPPDSIGVLSNTMNTVDVTAGFSGLVNLNLGGALEARYAERMKDYADMMSVMQNLRVTDILQGIIETFNRQLAGANTSVYESVDTELRTRFAAPFMREESARLWKIEVVKESNLFSGDKKKTIRFADYADYATNAVALQPLKGLSGTIDFTDPATYMNVDSGELDVYVRLAGENLNREIERIFSEGGSFPTHTDTEYNRLGTRFSKAYEDYMAGRALAASGWYEKGDFVMVNSALGVAAYALSSVTCGISMGVYMGLQMGINANQAYDLGGMKGLATNLGSLGVSSYIQATSLGMADVNVSYTRDGGFGGGLSFGNDTTFHGGVGYTTKSKDWNANAGYGRTTTGMSKTKQGGWGGTIQTGAYEVSYGEENGFSAAVSVPMGKEGKYGSMRFGMQFDDHLGWEGADINYITAPSSGDYFSGTQRFAFGYNEDSGYSLSAGTNAKSETGLGTDTTNTFTFDRNGGLTGAGIDASMRYTYDNYRDMREKSERTDKELTDAERADAERTREEMGWMERVEDMLSGAFLSMNNTIGQWGKDVADMVSDFGESLGNWASGDGFNTNKEVVVNAAMKELGRQEAVAAALGAYDEFSKNYDSAVKGAMGEYDRMQAAYEGCF